MSKVQASIDVNAPLSTVYNQWTQFEEFPRFMEAVEAVSQFDDTTLEWRAKIAGNEETWTAKITQQEPDEIVAWESTSGIANSGEVRFERLDANTTRVNVTMGWGPQGVIQKAGEVLGFDERQVKGDLERFKKFIESRGAETGGWRGTVEQGTTTS
jgi:uncharacterized membrane protein